MTRVYISSTYADLQDHRNKVYEQLRQMQYDLHAMEDYTATEERPLAYCLADVAKCDVYIGIIAWRYGYVPKDDPNNERSITELEYEEAGKRRIPRLVFVLKERHSWPQPDTDFYTGDGNGGQAIRDFRDRLQKAHITGFYTTPENLANQVSAAIANWEKNPRGLLPALPPEDRREQIITEIAVLLGELSVEGRQTIAVSLALDPAASAYEMAVCMVAQLPVLEVMTQLMGLVPEVSQAEARRIADIVNLLLPLNYMPDVVASLRDQVGRSGCGLVEHEVTTWSLAEILMAGYEQKAAQFRVVKTGPLRGEAAEDYGGGPEVGPGNNSAVVNGARYAVRETLLHLLAFLDAAPQRLGPLNVDEDIRDYASSLQQVLRVRQTMNRHKRRTYFVLQLPDNPAERDFLKTVLDDVGREAPGLFFIELAMRRKHEDEPSVDHFLLRMMQHLHSREEP